MQARSVLRTPVDRLDEDELQLELQLRMRRVGLVQVTPNGDDVVQSFGLQPVDHIAACQHHDGVAVLADFAVSLGVEMGASAL